MALGTEKPGKELDGYEGRLSLGEENHFGQKGVKWLVLTSRV